jgi:DNA polymerase III delta prime subunit
MDPRTNPYAPGAGTLPPELVGRDEIIEKAKIAFERCRNGLPARGWLIVGLRGVGRTVLISRLAREAGAAGFVGIEVEAPEGRSLPALLIPALRTALLKLNRLESAVELGKRALRVLGGFIGAMKVRYGDIEFGLDLGSELGVADSGDLEFDLTSLFVEMGRLAREKKTALILFIDEIQYLEEDQFAALIMALHRCAQERLPVLMVAAGLPQLVGRAGRAKSYAERLFEYPELSRLSSEAARKAIELPAIKLGVEFTAEALDEILNQTQGYPYFLQEWGKFSWDCAGSSPITLEDVQIASQQALSELDAGFFRVRLDRLTPNEKRYLRAMAELGPGSRRSGDIAEMLKKPVQTVAPVRASLIKKGMIFSIHHGENEFTVPLFDGYMKRVMPRLQE